MTDQQPHTPTATQIREDYAHLRYHFADGWSVGEERVQFDNWLTAELTAAEQRGAVKALRHEADNLIGHGSVWPIESVAGVTAAARKLHRRADEMEGKNEQHLS